MAEHEAWCVFGPDGCLREFGLTEDGARFKAARNWGDNDWQQLRDKGYTVRRVRIVEVTDGQ